MNPNRPELLPIDGLRGDALLPHDAAYDRYRVGWNVTVAHQPDVIVVAADENDVVAAIGHARRLGLQVTVQATGHGQPRSARSGMLLVISCLNQVTVDPAAATATVGGGTQWADVIEAAHPHGLVPLNGTSPGVGVVGYTLGGGFGLMIRQYGLTVDHVRSMRVVLPEGRLVTASKEQNPDLYWALLGGGGAYGVVTEMTLGLVPHGHLFGGNVMFDAAHARRVFDAWIEWTRDLPEAVSSALTLITFPPVPFVPEFLHGRSMVMLQACTTCDEQSGEALLRPMRELDGAEFDSFRWMPSPESGSIYNDPVDPLPANGRGALLNTLDPDAVEALLDAVGAPAESPNLMVQVRHIGGAMASVGAEATPLANLRRAQYLVYYLGVPMGPDQPAKMAAHAEVGLAALKPWILSRGPLNWLGEGDVSRAHIREVYAEHDYARLCEIKHSYDPSGLFANAGVGVPD